MGTIEPHLFLSGIILAAGASTRMGRPKQLLPLGRRCLLQRVIDAAMDSGLDEIVVVLGHRAEEIREALELPAQREARIVVTRDYALGQSESLRAGLRAANPEASAAAILLGDQPGITSQLIDRLAAECSANNAPIVRPVYDSGGAHVPGHPVFLARRIWPEVEKLEGDQGARVLIRAHPEWVTEIPMAGEPPHDINTEEDYRHALAIRYAP
jgi:molybdenum cofactor cytidylyltransferase